MTTDVLARRSTRLVAGRGWRVALVVVAAFFWAAAAAHAQGTSGSLPNPISSGDLDKILTRLALDASQRRVAENCHEQYIEDFKKLRDGEIEKFIAKTQEIQGRMPARKEIEEMISDRDRLLDKIARLDNTFFDQVMTVLTDEQQILLTRARMYRTRERYGGDMVQVAGFLVPAANIDLSDMYERFPLTPDERQMMQPAVMDYESKLTRMKKEISDSVLRMFLDIFDIMEAAGFDENSFQDPEKAQEAFNTVRNAWSTVSVKLMEKAMEVSDLNRKACKRIAESMYLEHGEKLTQQYYQQAYPELPTSDLPQLFRKALAFNDLTEEQWTNVNILRDDFIRQQQNIYEDMADAQDVLRATRTPFDMAGMGGHEPANDEIVDKLADLGDKHTKLVERTTDALNALLGTELQAKITEMEDPEVVQARAEAAAAEAEAFADTGMETVSDVPVATASQPIAVPEFRELVTTLKLDESSMAVAEQLHAAYVQQFTNVSEEVLGKVNEAQSKLWKFDEATSTTTGPTVAQVRELNTLRKAAAEAMRGVDDAFYRDLTVAVGSDPMRQRQIELLHHARTRLSYAVGPEMWIWGFGGQHSQLSSLDLVPICQDEMLLEEPNEAIDAILSAYDAEMTQAMRDRYEKAMAAQLRMDVANAEFMSARGAAGDGEVAAGVRYQQELADLSKNLNSASAEVARINKETMQKLRAALDEERGAALEFAFKRAAFPTVYRGHDEMMAAINKARSLKSLSPSQRENLEEVLADFQSKYESVCDRMVAILADTSGAIRPFAAEDMREYRRVESTIEKLEFERSELRARARRRVQDILSSEQLAQVGGMFAPRGATVAADTATP